MKEKSTQISMTIKVPKEGSQYICLPVILIDSVFRTGKSYYPQVFLEGWKYVVKGKSCLNILLKIKNFLLMNLTKKILMKKARKKFCWRKF